MTTSSIPPYPVLDSPTDDLQFRELYQRTASLIDSSPSGGSAPGSQGSTGEPGDRGLPGATGDPGSAGRDGRPQLVYWSKAISLNILTKVRTAEGGTAPDQVQLDGFFTLFQETSPYIHLGFNFYNHIPTVSNDLSGDGWQAHTLWTIASDTSYAGFSQRFIEESGISVETPRFGTFNSKTPFFQYARGSRKTEYPVVEFIDTDTTNTQHDLGLDDINGLQDFPEEWHKNFPKLYKPINPIGSGTCRLRILHDLSPVPPPGPPHFESFLRVQLSGSYIRFPRSVLLSSEN